MNPDPPSGSRCFVDANILIYYFVENPTYTPSCKAFFRRCAAGDIIGCISPMIVAEALHRIMLSDVQVQFSTPKPLSFIQRHPHLIAQLALQQTAAVAIQHLGFQFLSLDAATFAATARAAQIHSLLTDDASTVALIEQNKIPFLITNDDDFDHVSGITVCKPR